MLVPLPVTIVLFFIINSYIFVSRQLRYRLFPEMSFLYQSLVWLSLAGHLSLLNHPDWPAPRHLLTCLDASLDSKHRGVLDNVFFAFLSQGLVEGLACGCAG